MYAVLLEFIPYYLSCIKYEPILRPGKEAKKIDA